MSLALGLSSGAAWTWVSLRPKWLVGSAKPTETDEAVQPFDHDADDLERRRRERKMRRSGRA